MHRSVRWLPLGAAMALVPAIHGTGLAAQEGPPAPLPLREVTLPETTEAILSNGARVVVLPLHEVPLVTVNLVVPGGTASDPVGRAGTAALAARLMDRGTGTRSRRRIVEELEFLGARLTAVAGVDALSVRLTSLTGELEGALAVMADVVMDPTVPGPALERMREQSLSELRTRTATAVGVADRTFLHALYGSHPYGVQPTAESLAAISASDVLALHRHHVQPDQAFFVVAGDLEPETVVRQLDAAFDGWTGGGETPMQIPSVADRAAPEVILVHRPGSIRAEVRIGHLLGPLGHGDWTALTVATRVLGGDPWARLSRVLRDGRGYARSPSSRLERRRGQGYFEASMTVPNPVLEAALTDMVREIERLRDQLVPPGELEDAKEVLVGSLPLELETAEQVADRAVRNRILGVPDEAVETFRSRVASLDAERVREVFRRQVDPGKMVILVVGDAAALGGQLDSFGPVSRRDFYGNSLSDFTLKTVGRLADLSAAELSPVAMSYRVLFQGTLVGNTDRILERGADGTLRFASISELGRQVMEQEVTVGIEELDFRTGSLALSTPGRSVNVDVRMEGGRIVGTLSSTAETRAVDLEVPDGVLVSDMLELAVWVADLTEGASFEFPVANIQSGTVENVRLTVLGREELTVPAGTFDTFRIRVSGSEAQTLWARVAAPHVVVQLQPAGQPILVQLTALTDGG